jgi:hypothetical protein
MHIPTDLDLPSAGTSSDGGGGFGGAAGVCARATDVRHAIKPQRMEDAILIVQAPGSGREWIIWRNGALLATRSRRKNHVDVEEIQRENVARYPHYSGLNLMPLTTVRLDLLNLTWTNNAANPIATAN